MLLSNARTPSDGSQPATVLTQLLGVSETGKPEVMTDAGLCEAAPFAGAGVLFFLIIVDMEAHLPVSISRR